MQRKNSKKKKNLIPIWCKSVWWRWFCGLGMKSRALYNCRCMPYVHLYVSRTSRPFLILFLTLLCAHHLSFPLFSNNLSLFSFISGQVPVRRELWSEWVNEWMHTHNRSESDSYFPAIEGSLAERNRRLCCFFHHVSGLQSSKPSNGRLINTKDFAGEVLSPLK